MATGVVLATKAARVSYNTFRLHQRNDPEFAAQIHEAEAQGAELLHYACFQRAVEGNLEPVYFQGKVVGHVRKFDTRLQIEFLRAHLPQLFKTPGAPAININAGQQILVLDAATRRQIQAARAESLRRAAGLWKPPRENGQGPSIFSNREFTGHGSLRPIRN
jgi:hypothetical protein